MMKRTPSTVISRTPSSQWIGNRGTDGTVHRATSGGARISPSHDKTRSTHDRPSTGGAPVSPSPDRPLERSSTAKQVASAAGGGHGDAHRPSTSSSGRSDRRSSGGASGNLSPRQHMGFRKAARKASMVTGGRQRMRRGSVESGVRGGYDFLLSDNLNAPPKGRVSICSLDAQTTIRVVKKLPLSSPVVPHSVSRPGSAANRDAFPLSREERISNLERTQKPTASPSLLAPTLVSGGAAPLPARGRRKSAVGGAALGGIAMRPQTAHAGRRTSVAPSLDSDFHIDNRPASASALDTLRASGPVTAVLPYQTTFSSWRPESPAPHWHVNLERRSRGALPRWLWQRVNLHVMHIGDNELTEISEDIAKLESLRELSARNNRLGALPRTLLHCLRLQKLDVSYNEISELPPNFFSFLDLRECWLSHNNLNALPPVLEGAMPHLQVLDVSHNNISELPLGLEQLHTLVQLNASFNSLWTIPNNIRRLNELQVLNVSNNFLQTLPIADLKLMLTTADRAPRLRSVECRGNPDLLRPPREIAEQGGKAVALYLRAMVSEDDVVENTEMVLVVCGERFSGKTAMINALFEADSEARGERIVRESSAASLESSLGADSLASPDDGSVAGSEGDLASRRDSEVLQRFGGGERVGVEFLGWQPDPDLSFQVVDLTGQTLSASILQLFLVRRAVFLLVWRLRRPQREGREDAEGGKATGGLPEWEVSYMEDTVVKWVDSLQHRVPGAHVQLVATHRESVEDEASVEWQCRLVQRAVEDRLAFHAAHRRGEGPNGSWRTLPVVGGEKGVGFEAGGASVMIDSVTGYGISELRELVLRISKQSNWYGERIPSSYMALRDKIRHLAIMHPRPWLTWGEYVATANRCGVSGGHLRMATALLNEMGVLRHFEAQKRDQEIQPKRDSAMTISRVEAMRRDLLSSRRGNWLEKEDEKSSGEGNEGSQGGDPSSRRASSSTVMSGGGDRAEKPQSASQGEEGSAQEATATAGKEVGGGLLWAQEELVYINMAWLVATVKGLMNQHLSVLLRFFSEGQYASQPLLRRVRRMMTYGVVHPSLFAFLWPRLTTWLDVDPDSIRAYWDLVEEEGRLEPESEMVALDEEGMVGALKLVMGLQLCAVNTTKKSFTKVEGDKSWTEKMQKGVWMGIRSIVVPGLLSQSHAFRIDSRTFSHHCLYRCCIQYPSLPPGFLDRLVVGLRGSFNHMDFNAHSAALYWMGHKLQIFVSTDHSSTSALSPQPSPYPKVRTGTPVAALRRQRSVSSPTVTMIVALFSSTRTWATFKFALLSVEAFYTGLKPISFDFEISEGARNRDSLSHSLSSSSKADWGGAAMSMSMSLGSGPPGNLNRVGTLSKLPSRAKMLATWDEEGPRGKGEGGGSVMGCEGAGGGGSERFEGIENDLRSVKDPVQVLIVHSEGSYTVAAELHELLYRRDQSIEVSLKQIRSGEDNVSGSDEEFEDGANGGEDQGRREQCLVMVICIDQALAGSKEAVTMFRRHVHNNGPLIAAIMPGYQVTDYSQWWPETMPELRGFSLFVDLNCPEWTDLDWKLGRLEFYWSRPDSKFRLEKMAKAGDGWAEAELSQAFGHEYVMEQKEREIKVVGLHEDICRILEEWRGVAQTEPFSDHTRVACYVCMKKELVKPSTFLRTSLEPMMFRWRESYSSALLQKKPPPASPIIACDKGHEVQVQRLLSKVIIHNSVPCPSCLHHGITPPWGFNRQQLTSFFEEESKRSGVMTCPNCAKRNLPPPRVMDIIPPQVFLSYQWGNEFFDADGTRSFSTQALIRLVRDHLERQLDLLCWLDVGGGLAAGQDHILQMTEGIRRASVVVVFLSDRYVNSLNCKRELGEALRTGKHLIPVLMDRQGEGPEYDGTGWSGPLVKEKEDKGKKAKEAEDVAADSDAEEEDWWRHAERTCREPTKPAFIKWSLLNVFTPIDARGQPFDKTLVAITNMLLSRFSRVQQAADATVPRGRRQWNKVKIARMLYGTLAGGSKLRDRLHGSLKGASPGSSPLRHLSDINTPTKALNLKDASPGSHQGTPGNPSTPVTGVTPAGRGSKREYRDDKDGRRRGPRDRDRDRDQTKVRLEWGASEQRGSVPRD